MMSSKGFVRGRPCSHPGCDWKSVGRDLVEAAYDFRMHMKNVHERVAPVTSTSAGETRTMSLPSSKPFFDPKTQTWVYVCNFPGCRVTDADYNSLIRHIQTVHDNSRDNYLLARNGLRELAAMNAPTPVLYRQPMHPRQVA
jgi:hypothetical protein